MKIALKKRTSLIAMIITLICTCFGLVACTTRQPPEPIVEFSINKTSLTLDEFADDVQLSANVYVDGEVVDDVNFSWSSSNEKVVKVKNGLVTVCDIGSATITCGYEDLTKTCSVTVNESNSYVLISSASQLINAMTSNEDVAYKLANDIILTDKQIDSQSTFQSGAYCFNADFAGMLNGNYKQIVLNLKSQNGVAFDGVFKSISGIIKKVNFIITLQTNYSTNEYGILTPSLTGRLDKCIVNYDNSASASSGLATLVKSMGANAKITNLSIYRLNTGVTDYQIAKYVQPTSCIENVIIVGNNWGWASPPSASSKICKALPTTKCVVNGVYLIECKIDANTVTKIILCQYSYRLNVDKYNSASSPSNVIKSGNTVTNAEITILFESDYSSNAISTEEEFGYCLVGVTSVMGESRFLLGYYVQ